MAKPDCIVINAFDRGGSNILWNIMQSHPQVCSSFGETNQIMTGRLFPRLPFLPRLLRHDKFGLVRGPLKSYIRRNLDDLKMLNFQCPRNREKFQGVDYTEAEVRNSVLCAKSVDEDIAYSDLFKGVFGNVRFLCLVRNGYALCEGWMRRGTTASDAGKKYERGTSRMLRLCENAGDAVMIKFEEMVEKPFATAERLYAFCELEPPSIPKIRLKSKRVVTAGGSHEPKFGVSGQKYWFGPTEIAGALDVTVNQRQSDSLSDADRKLFDVHAGEKMRRLGYA